MFGRQTRRPAEFPLFSLLVQKAAASHVLMTAAELLCAEWPGDGVKAARRSHAQLKYAMSLRYAALISGAGALQK